MSSSGSPLDLPGSGSSDGLVTAPGPRLVDWGLFVLRASRRRWKLGLSVLVGGVVLTAATLATSTPMYKAEVRILAQRQQALPSVARGAVPDELPTRSAFELVHKRENVLHLIKQTDLLASETATERGLQEGARALLAMLGFPANREDPLSALVQRVDRSLIVSTADGTLTITVFWPDPHKAYELVEAALQTFLEARQLQEITAVDDTIVLLQGRVAVLREQLDLAIDQASRESGGLTASPGSQAQQPSALPAPGGSEELARLKSSLEAKERAIRDMEELRRRRLFDLQAQLAEKRGIYSDAYPSIVALRQEIEALGKESPQVAALRDEERKLREDYLSRVAADARTRTDHARSQASVRSVNPLLVEQNERVRDARLKYQQMVDRLNAAQLDLDTARAAFKYRYSVVWPAQVPKKPVSPNVPKIGGVGLLLSIVAAVLASALPDLLSRRVFEPWQVDRLLGVPVLGRIRSP